MPCYDGREDNENRANRAYAKGIDSFYAEIRHNSDLAQMLCFMCRLVDGAGDMSKFPADIQQWWKEHQKRDKARNP